MIFEARVEVRALEGLANPEGRTIERALPALGFTGVRAVEVGKIILFQLDAVDEHAALSQVGKMCNELLANPVIERTSIAVSLLDEVPT